MEAPFFTEGGILIVGFVVLTVMSGLFTLIEKYPENTFSNTLYWVSKKLF